MCIGEPDPLVCQPIKVRCGDFGFRIVAADIPIAEIIGEDDDDVGFRLLWRISRLRSQRGKKQGCEEG
jgi:hypothetical protein